MSKNEMSIDDLVAVLRKVTMRVAPAWPLDGIVAVNPYAGIQDHTFVQGTTLLRRVAGARSTMTDEQFRARISSEQGRRDLEWAIVESGSSLTSERVLHLLNSGQLSVTGPEITTVADVLQNFTGAAWSRFSVEQVGAFLASYFDEGYAAWQPSRGASLFSTWKTEAAIDRSPEVMGAKGFRDVIRSLPDPSQEAASAIVARLGIAPEALELYLHRLLMRVGGWSAYASRLAWEAEQYHGASDDTAVELLTVLLAFELALHDSTSDERFEAQWRLARQSISRLATSSSDSAASEARALLQRASERAFQRSLAERINAQPRSAGAAGSRPRAQAVFCIDVRSEVFRRHLEGTDPEIETFGFAGFFGFAVEYVPLAHSAGAAHCPVLLKPGYRVHETVTKPDEAKVATRHRVEQRAIQSAWKSFKQGAISCFSFVGPLGLAYLPKLLTDSLSITRPVTPPALQGLGRFADQRRPELNASDGTQQTGIALPQRIELAERALKGMSLTSGFARIVLLVGHGSTSVNNPHASGLNCGACGGKSGEANARIAAEVLNDVQVRRGLQRRGISIPDDTLFLAALHDTTTDHVTLLSHQDVPRSHQPELERLQQSLASAARNSCEERARRLPELVGSAGQEWFRRSRDWAQVRPEWGLAGCASFIAAPRHRTAGVDLEGRAFLHSYCWEQDADASILELVMTAPMLVASWINLQYYGSTVDPQLFGAGNKTLHNIVGGSVGVIEGSGGDLRIGLPLQSVHDGESFQHEPVRLNAVIEAPTDAINAVLQKHEKLRQLIDNGWICLFAMDEQGQLRFRYRGDLTWTEADDASEPQAWSQAS